MILLTRTLSDHDIILINSIINNDSRIVIRNFNQDAIPVRELLIENTSPYIGFLNAGGKLDRAALIQVDAALSADEPPELVFSDHDFTSVQNPNITNPFYKPGWSPDLILSSNYFYPLCVFSKDLMDPDNEVQLFDNDNFYGLYLSLHLRLKRAFRIPGILYHDFPNTLKPFKSNTSRVSEDISNYLAKSGLDHPKAYVDSCGSFRVTWDFNKDKVSIIILSPGSNNLLQNCIESIISKTKYPNYEIIIVNNGDKRPEYFPFYRKIFSYSFIKILQYDGDFNYSKLNNYAANFASGKYLVFLNNDTEVISEDWLDDLVMWGSQEKIGAVGPLLLKKDETIQHAGVVVGLGGFASHIFEGLKEDSTSIFGKTKWYRNYSALTAACLLIRKNLFLEVGGFDEEFILNGSDVALGIKLSRKGLNLVLDPFVKLYHHESATHQGKIPKKDFLTSFIYYKEYLDNGDPFFNPSLSIWSTIPKVKPSSEGTAIESALQKISEINENIFSTYHYQPIDYSAEGNNISTWLDVTPDQLSESRRLHELFTDPINIKTVSWFIPEFKNAFYGGIYTILRFADFMARTEGIRNRFYIINECDEKLIYKLITDAFPCLQGSIIKTVVINENWDPIDPSDISIATSWASAYFCVKFNKVKRKFYFIQDYEPLFFPAGSGYGQVEATYRFGFYGLTNTPSLKEIYENQYGGRAKEFYPCVDRQVFYPLPDTKRSQPPFSVFFYGRPDHPRNGFELGIAAIKMFKQIMGDKVIIYSAGSNWSPKLFGLEGIVNNLGLLSIEQTAELYRTCDAGLVMMFTKHPSYIPFELMASKCLVVTNKNSATKWLLKDQENCILTEATPSCIADALLSGIKNIELRKSITNTAYSLIRNNYSIWEDQFDRLFHFMKVIN